MQGWSLGQKRSRLRVEEIFTASGQIRYVVVDADGEWVEPVVRYLRYLDSIGRAKNTLRAYAYDLALYFEFLALRGLDYEAVNVEDIGKFVEWMKEPAGSQADIIILPMIQPRKDHTINRALTTLAGFYTSLWHRDGLQVGPRMKTDRPGRFRAFKGFLHHLTAGQTYQANLVRQPWTRTGRPSTLTKEEIETLVAAAVSERDKLLIVLLYESGLRIGEALALWMEDIERFDGTITVRDRGTLVNGAEIKSPSSVRVVDVSDALLDRLIHYVGTAHRGGVKTNHVFVKLRGPQAGQPLSYPEVNDLFQRLKKATGIDAHAHLLRHSMATELAEDGWKPEELQKRLGHAQYQTTFNLYVHPTDKSLRRAFERSQERLKIKEKGNADLVQEKEDPGSPMETSTPSEEGGAQ